MNRAVMSRIISSIPERSARAPSGSAFDPQHAGSEAQERVTRLSRHLQWLGPLSPLTREEQRDFGLGPAHLRPVLEEPADEDEDPPGEPAAQAPEPH